MPVVSYCYILHRFPSETEKLFPKRRCRIRPVQEKISLEEEVGVVFPEVQMDQEVANDS